MGDGSISGKADFSLSGTLNTAAVDFQGGFSGELKLGSTKLATAEGAIDSFGCLRGSITYLNGTGTVVLPDHALQPQACGPQLTLDSVSFTETDTSALHHVAVHLSQPADHQINIQYSIEMVSGNADPRDKAGDEDVVFKQLQTVSIPVGQIQAMIPVTILGDNNWEANEIFRVRVASAPGVSLAVDQALITILDDDLDNLVDSVLDALLPSDRSLAWYDFQDDNNALELSADRTATYVAATPMTHSAGMNAGGSTGLPDD